MERSFGETAIGLAGSILGAQRHVCAFFHNRDQEYAVLTPFVKEGLDRGEKAIHIIDPARRDDHARRLQSAGIDTTAALRSGQFEIYDWSEAHLHDGHFDQHRMLRLAEEAADRARQTYPSSRFVTHMEWALEDCPGVEDLLEYEARANRFWIRHDDPVICTYDLKRFRGDTIVNLMRTHPVILVGGIFLENPFFAQPEESLREQRQAHVR